MTDAKLRCNSVEIGSIVIRCYEFDRMLAFWQAALQYEPTRPADGGWVILRDPKGLGPRISLDQVPERRSGKRGWLHLDLYTTDQAREVERLVGLGADRYPWRYRPDDDFIVLRDPDGNLFCVVEVPPGTD
jgi:catechol 2,3-dioxygenase-like lactoylglutathione lyase family enzyme